MSRQSMVFELGPSKVVRRITQRINAPTLGYSLPPVLSRKIILSLLICSSEFSRRNLVDVLVLV